MLGELLARWPKGRGFIKGLLTVMNASIRTLTARTLTAAVFVAMSLAASAQNKAAIEKKLTSEYTTTQATADMTDIVTAGSILVLKKGNIMMAPVTATNYFQNTYKDGRITQNALGKINNGLGRLSRLGVPGAAPPPATGATRTFVPGEKMWVTKIECKDDGLVFQLFTDAFAEVRYKADLKFFFDKKGSIPMAEDMDKLVAEVFKIQPPESGDNAAAAGGQQQQAAPAAPPSAAPPPAAEAAPAPIPPPPPPPDAPVAPPVELKIGQTKDAVIANFGQPEKIVKVGTKEIYYYKDLGKVTFVNGKVTDVQ
jgi:hypothetical protein